MRNPKTTIGGWMLIAGSLTTFLARWSVTGIAPDETQWQLLFGFLNSGVVAILAADGRRKDEK